MLGFREATKTNLNNRKELEVLFAPNAASAVTKTYGNGLTPARTGVGTATITLADPPGGVFAGAEVQASFAAASTKVLQVLGFNATTNVLTVQMVTMSTGAAVEFDAANANHWVRVRMIFCSPTGN